VPEPADVEVYRRYLNATALHQRIAGTHAESEEILQGTSPQGLGRALKDNQFDSSRRHGKYLFIELHNGGNHISNRRYAKNRSPSGEKAGR